MTDTIRRDSIRRRSNEAFARQENNSRRVYENSQLRRESQQSTVRKRNDDSEPHSIDIDMSKLNSALQNGTLFG